MAAVIAVSPRRHDLDALRASAMLLGIVYHACLSFALGFPWMIQDAAQSHALFVFQGFVHGFRMQLFFLLSGFFTAMLLRKKGAKALIWHRFKRVCIPALIGLATIVPAMNWASWTAIGVNVRKMLKNPAANPAGSNLWSAIKAGDVAGTELYLAKPGSLTNLHAAFSITPLSWAAIWGRTNIVTLLLDHGADVNARDRDGTTALHSAAFFGRDTVVALLLQRGADPGAASDAGETPERSASSDFGTVEFIGGLLGVPVDKPTMQPGRERAVAILRSAEPPQWAAVKAGDLDLLGHLLSNPALHATRHPTISVTPLSWAVIWDHTNAIALLLDHGANVRQRNADGSTALHTAAFFGRDQAAALLLRRGAEINAASGSGETPLKTAMGDVGIVEFIGAAIGVPVDKAATQSGRERTLGLLKSSGGLMDPDAKAVAEGLSSAKPVRPASKAAGGVSAKLNEWIETPVFILVWFLWFLWWLVIVYSAAATYAAKRGWTPRPLGLVMSPVKLLWLVPVTAIPGWFMNGGGVVFGPDTSMGIIPMPHVFAYYLLFFMFGALYFDCADAEGRLGASWRWSLPIAVLLVLPVGLEAATGTFGLRDKYMSPVTQRAVTAVFGALFAWMMSLGCMGMFRTLLKVENKVIRYLSDSSYWLYLAHLPLIIYAQSVIWDWPGSAWVKLTILTVAITSFLLVTYEFFVRHTPIGWLLNGPRPKRGAKAAAE
jgi:ankyrin repeat protein/peptidoglycan/LPS O-acetylase OafA/YrhL